jgi:hypothetical protein
MAEFISWSVSITTMDGVLRESVSSFNITQSEAQEYMDAADDTERAASAVGQTVAAYLAMTDAAFVKTTVSIEVKNDPVTNPGDSVLRGNKLMFHCRSGGRGLVFTVPARKASAYAQSVDSLQVSLTTPAAMAAFVGDIENYVTDQFGHSVDVVSAEVVD